MDSSGRVGNITSSSGISSTDSGNGSRGDSSDVERSAGRDGAIASGVGQGIAGISSIAKTVVAKAISTIEVGVSRPLGNMDGSSRVGNITSSSSIGSSDSGNGSGGSSGDVQRTGGGHVGVAGHHGGNGMDGRDHRGSSHNRGSGVDGRDGSSSNDGSVSGVSGISQAISSISKTVSGVSQTVVSEGEVGVSVGIPLGHVDGSGRVGDIASSGSVAGEGSGHSSRSQTSDVH